MLIFTSTDSWIIKFWQKFEMAILNAGHQRSRICDLKSVFKFRVDWICSFEDIFDRTFCKFGLGLKRLIWPQNFVLGSSDP